MASLQAFSLWFVFYGASFAYVLAAVNHPGLANALLPIATSLIETCAVSFFGWAYGMTLLCAEVATTGYLIAHGHRVRAQTTEFEQARATTAQIA